MACCKAKNGNTICNGQIFRCERCGATGCAKSGCQNQKFNSNNGTCTVCGGNIKRAVI